MDKNEVEVLKQQFVMHVNRRFPNIKILKVAEVLLGVYVAVVQEGDGRPFLVGKRHGHLVPIKREVLTEAEERYKTALDDVRGTLDILRAHDPQDPEKWKPFMQLVGIEPPTSD